MGLCARERGWNTRKSRFRRECYVRAGYESLRREGGREERARREKGGFAFSGMPNRGFIRNRDATSLPGQGINSRWNYRAILSLATSGIGE